MRSSKHDVHAFAYMMQPQNFSVNDGEGIRTLLFFSGCPLRCAWCSNPECFSANKESEYVRKYSVEEIREVVDKQKVFYRQSGGGVTFSGGEATGQLEMLDRLSEIFYDDGLSLALETCGYFNFEKTRPILERMDLIFMDLKIMDRDGHLTYTGKDNDLILKNLSKIDKLGCDLVVRVPVIDGVNATYDNMRQTAQFIKENVKTPKIELLPYHQLGMYKYEKLGLEKPSRTFKTPSSEMMDAFEALIRSLGVETVSYK